MTTFNSMSSNAYVKITQKPVEDFLMRFFLLRPQAAHLIIVTPLMATLARTHYPLTKLRRKIEADKIRTFVITRKPEEIFHIEAVRILGESDMVEVRYNNSLHAKLYVCMGEDTSFAMLGSGNLTKTSLERNIEIGMLISSKERGKQLLHQLYYWGSVRLRTLEESKLAKIL